VAQCVVIGPVCGSVGVCGFVITITRNCVHRSSPKWVCIGKCSDHLQLIKLWPSRAPGKGVCDGAKNFRSALLYSHAARSVCVSLWALFSLLLSFRYFSVVVGNYHHRFSAIHHTRLPLEIASSLNRLT